MVTLMMKLESRHIILVDASEALAKVLRYWCSPDISYLIGCIDSLKFDQSSGDIVGEKEKM